MTEPSDQEPPRRGYRLLLAAFPRRYRRQRGLEMLTTLLDSAPAGRRRPTWGQALELMAAGVRVRFRPPRGRLFPLLAAVVALTIGLFGAAAGNWLGWRGAGPLPADAAAVALARAATGQEPMSSPVRREAVFDYDDGMSNVPLATAAGYRDDYGPGRVRVAFPVAGGPREQLIGVRQRLRDDGWQVGPVRRDRYGETTLSAARDRHVVHVGRYGGEGEVIGPDSLSVVFYRATPPAAGWLALAGALIGLLAGWLLVVRLAWHVADRSAGVRVVAAVCAGVGVCLSFLTTLTTALGALMLTADWLIVAGPARPTPLWGAYMTIFRIPAVLGLFVLALGVAIVASTRRSDRSGAGLARPA